MGKYYHGDFEKMGLLHVVSVPCLIFFVPDTDVLILACQMLTTIKIVSFYYIFGWSKKILGTTIWCQIVIIAIILGYLKMIKKNNNQHNCFISNKQNFEKLLS